ncbi:MAG: diaminopimelate epimerase [Pseudomonadota bacterium]|nr:diaminopimelate epimerase [Pseudomonadota bacterium]
MIARKMNGAGNRFILIDVRGQAGLLEIGAETVRHWARQHAFDQLLALEDSDTGDAFMRIWNADGDEVGACGNGTRAAGWVLLQESGADTVAVATAGGLLFASQTGQMQVSVDMGEPRLDWQDIPLSREMDTREMDVSFEAAGLVIDRPGAVNMGNPHAVFFIRDVETFPVDRLGPEVELDPVFPERVNASFAQIYDRRHIRLRVWERGVGITLACGTAACATLVAAHRRGLADRQASIMADGGELHIEWREQDNHIIMTGPVEDEGEIHLSTGTAR